jgi:hypothetical protein
MKLITEIKKFKVMLEMHYASLYERSEYPFGKSWEKWAAIWCEWMLSIPKKKNPSIDKTGRYCSRSQNYDEVWFLAGTFGNIVPVKRKCTIPAGRAIFFPILVKEDSLKEDSDLKTELEMCNRSRDATNRLISMEATVDGQEVGQLEKYRVQSEVFDLIFPEDNVYNVQPGSTRAVCDGYWLFIKPLQIGEHNIHFKGETSLDEVHTIAQLRNSEVHSPILQHINENLTFKLEVSYEIRIIEP